MRAERPRAAGLALAALLAACSRPTPPVASLPATPAGFCRTAPDGGPPGRDRADRGIGGTGAPAQIADRGIGGTGAPLQVADRGIGGTGIIAVITGFASVCLAGQEVALDADVPVSFNDRSGSASSLRAGQVAVVDAAGTGSALRARRIAIRHEVSGPVEAADGEQWRIAGQAVAVTAATLGDRLAVGDWGVVSGLRRPDGVIEATRLDRRDRLDQGDVIVRGRLRWDGALHIGALLVRPAPGLMRLVGQDVTATGVIEGGTLIPEQVVPDVLASDPAALFGAGVGFLYVESFAAIEGGRVRFGQGFSAAAPGFGPAGARRGVLALERGAGGLRAVGFGPNPGPGGERPGPLRAAPMPSRQFEPAPTPNRGMRAPGAGPGRQEGGMPRSGERGERPGGRAGGQDRGGMGGFGPGPGGDGPPPGRGR